MEKAYYPLAVRASGWGLTGHVIGSVALTGVMIAGAVLMLPLMIDAWYMAIFGVGCMAMALFFAWDGLQVATHCTSFDAEGVTVGNLFGEQRMQRSELAGWRWGQPVAGLGRVELYRKGAELGRPMIASIPKQENATVAAWFEGAADLTLKAKIDGLREIKADEDFGHTPEERLQNAVSEERIVSVLHWLAIGVAFWLKAFPRPYWIAIATGIVFPVVVVMLTAVRRDRWRIDRGKEDLRPQTGRIVFLVALGLVLRAIFDWSIIDGWRLAGIVAAFAALATILVAVVTREEVDRWKAVTWVVVAAIYGYGALTPANEWFDRSTPTPYRAVVEAKRTDSVRLQPWGPMTAAHDAGVSDRTLATLEQGGEACVLLFRGALGVRSYDVVPCENMPYRRRD